MNAPDPGPGEPRAGADKRLLGVQSRRSGDRRDTAAADTIYLCPIVLGELVYLQLSRKGRPIPTNDLWLAAVALRHGLDLLTRDSHFLDVEGLRVVGTASDYLF